MGRRAAPPSYAERARSLLLGGEEPFRLVALSELPRDEHSPLVEERERDDRFEDADALAAEDAREPELRHVGADLADRLEGGDRAALDRVGLHDHLEARERVGDDDINRRDDRRRDQVRRRLPENPGGADLLLNPLLQPRLADEAEDR